MGRTRLIALGCLLGLSVAPTASRADLPQRAGWPLQLDGGTSGGYVLAPQEGVALADVDGQPGLEVIASSGEQVWVWSADGVALPGWPATVLGTAQAPPSVGDVDGDGAADIVQVARGLQYSDTSHVHALSASGAELAGWPLSYPNLIFNAATLADADLDGAMDLFVQLGEWPPAGTFVGLTGAGQPLGSNWEHVLDSYPLAPAAVGDLDGDGTPEVAYLTLGAVTVRNADGELRAGFPIQPTVGMEHAGSVVMADLAPELDGLELAWCEMEPVQVGATLSLQAAANDGQPLAGFPVVLSDGASGVGPLTVGDIDGDGMLDIAAPVPGVGVTVVAASGAILAAFDTMAALSASVQQVDLDGDGDLELIVDNNTGDTDGRGYVEAYQLDGSPVTDFPLRPMGMTLSNGGTVGDLDGDGQLELVVISAVIADPPVTWVNVWTLPAAQPAPKGWAAYGFDQRRANCFGCAGSEGAGGEGAADDDSEDDGGCGCRAAPPGEVPTLAWLVALLSLTRWRRRGAKPR